MALDITAQDLIVDESAGLQNDDTSASDSTITYLLSLDAAGGLSSPQIAFKADFITASATGSDSFSSVSLTQNINGAAFSTTVGVNSDLRTVDGNYVWLFKDPGNSSVVIGVIGTSDAAAMPNLNNPYTVAFALALVNTNTTTPDLYTAQYVPLLHPLTNDPDDRIDLTSKVFASLSGSTTVSFSGANAASGNPDFYIINSPTDAAKQILVIGQGGTANVSTQGFGIGNQSINPNETLQVDFVTGGTLASGSASEIDYGNHLEDVTKAGFTINQITPSNPDKRVDITITALNADGNVKGTDFYDGSPANAVDITSITLTGASGFASTINADGDYVTGSGTVHVSGLTGTGNAVTITGLDNVTVVDFTAATPIDRLLVTGVDANEGCDITEFHFTTTSPNSHTEEVGSFINFDDDGPSISTTGTEPQLTVDESVLTTDDSKSFAANFSSAYGSDGAGTLTYALSVVAGPSGLTDTATGQAVNLSLNGGVVEGRTASSNDLVFTVSVDSSGNVTLDQRRAVVHANANDDNESRTLAADNLVKLTATITDKDGDSQAATLNIGQNLNFLDDGPNISTTGTEPQLSVDESTLATDDSKSFAGNFSSGYGADGAGTLAYALSVGAGATGLTDTATGQAVVLSVNGGVVEGRTATSNDLVFTVSVNSSGSVTLDQKRGVVHANPLDPNDTKTLAADDLIKLTATITDKDGDHQAATLNIGQNLTFVDDAPTLTAAFDADPVAPGTQTPEHLLNGANQTASGTFGYDIGADQHSAAYYTAGGSDFVDADLVTPGVQISLTGTVSNAQNSGITDAVATLTSESATSATFSFSFGFDKDPITVGIQGATAGGTLVFDKVNDTYTFTLTDVIDAFAFDVLHTNELVAKQPGGNTGHPLIVAEQLTPNGDPDPFFVQFTGNSVTNSIKFGFNLTGDGSPLVGVTTFNNGGDIHDLVTNGHEDWVSATQSTNGVAGDTIQKGELLTLRFFDTDILGDVNPGTTDGGTERLDPTATTSGVIIKFDGIGNSEDLVLILDLKASNGDEITRAINVQNSDLIKGNANIPAPYNTEFTLDNNDALLIIEQNDYTVAGETYQIQGLQIMQSGNGLGGTAINLNGATGTNGFSPITTGLTAWDPTDNDVLKIVDIGFVQQTGGTVSADLNFAFNIADGDGDLLGLQNIPVQIANSFV